MKKFGNRKNIRMIEREKWSTFAVPKKLGVNFIVATTTNTINKNAYHSAARTKGTSQIRKEEQVRSAGLLPSTPRRMYAGVHNHP